MRVHVPPSEMYMAAQAGFLRTIQNIYAKAKSAYGADQDGIDWKIAIEGGIGEYVVAKALNIHWTGKGVMRGDDVGEYQVRTTPYENGCLLLHPRDEDEKVFILVTGKAPEYEVKGWIRGADGKKQEFWKDGNRPCYFVPQSELKAMADL